MKFGCNRIHHKNSCDFTKKRKNCQLENFGKKSFFTFNNNNAYFLCLNMTKNDSKVRARKNRTLLGGDCNFPLKVKLSRKGSLNFLLWILLFILVVLYSILVSYFIQDQVQKKVLQKLKEKKLFFYRNRTRELEKSINSVFVLKTDL